ncbi:MAG: metallophosphoesterase [Bacteroidetes bacterium]|nr:metallophosphoesterase [Bacteroidota bacterium]
MYDIIGDVHGHADALENLLVKLGYYMVDGIYQHPDRRQLIFVGDLIDRGSQIRETLQLVKNMCDAGYAKVVMGNHEYNAICFHTPHIEKGGFFRNHSLKEIKQHIRTLEQFEGYEDEWELYLAWFKTMPLFLELPHFNVVHAFWHEAHIAWIKKHYSKMDPSFLTMCCNQDDRSGAYNIIEQTLKGIETPLPVGITNPDKEGNHRKDCRVKWWMPLEARQTMNDLLIPCPEVMKHQVIDQDKTYAHYEGTKPVFFGHYALKYKPVIENPLAICTDYNITHGGLLLACRVDIKDQSLTTELIY